MYDRTVRKCRLFDLSKIVMGIAIDGKSLKHSYDKKAGNRAINMVSAWLQFS